MMARPWNRWASMETTAYVRYVRRWATNPDNRCDGQYEIDLLAIDPVTLNRHHIETSISISEGFSCLPATRLIRTISRGLTSDDILDNITITWLTNTAISGARLYWEISGKDISMPKASLSLLP